MLYAVYAQLAFLILMLLVVLIGIPASLFGKIRGGNFIYTLCSLWADSWFALVGIRHTNIYLAPHDTHRAYIFVANHISYMDIPVIVKAVRQPTRILGKAEMAKIPLFGFIYNRAAVTVDRSSPENRARSVKVLKCVVKKGVSIVIYPEGTFNLTDQPLKDFYDGAFRIAIESQTPIKPLILPDTLDRLHYKSIFALTPGISRAVFMEEVPVEGLALTDTQQLRDKVHALMTEELRKWRGEGRFGNKANTFIK